MYRGRQRFRSDGLLYSRTNSKNSNPNVLTQKVFICSVRGDDDVSLGCSGPGLVKESPLIKKLDYCMRTEPGLHVKLANKG